MEPEAKVSWRDKVEKTGKRIKMNELIEAEATEGTAVADGSQ